MNIQFIILDVLIIFKVHDIKCYNEGIFSSVAEFAIFLMPKLFIQYMKAK